METKIKRDEIFTGKVIHVVKDEVRLEDGNTSSREVVYHNGGVCIALKDLSDHKFFMVKQFRYAHNTELLEFCAGKIEKGEEPDLAIERECVEELGYKAKNITKFPYMIPTCGYSSEKIYLYYGESDEKVGQHFDFDEDIKVINIVLEKSKI